MLLLRSKNLFYVGFCSWLSSVPLNRKKIIIREFHFCSNSFFPLNKICSKLSGYILTSIFNQQVFWNSKSTEHCVCPKSNFRSFFFPGLLFICCYWVPRMIAHWHTLGIFHELDYKQEEKTNNTQWQFPSLHSACLCHCDCSTGRMFKPSRAVLGGVMAPKLGSFLHGSCLLAFSITAGRFGSRMEMRTDLLWMEKTPKEKWKWLSPFSVPGGGVEEKVLSWLCYHWNKLLNKVLPPVQRGWKGFHPSSCSGQGYCQNVPSVGSPEQRGWWPCEQA